MKMTLRFISDPGHGWLEVSKGLLRELGIKPDQISSFSYQNATHAFLEEDCDAGVALDALKARGDEVLFDEVYQEHTPIRNMRGWRMSA